MTDVKSLSRNLVFGYNRKLLTKDLLEMQAKLICGGTREGCFVKPTVLVDVPKDCDVATDDVGVCANFVLSL